MAVLVSWDSAGSFAVIASGARRVSTVRESRGGENNNKRQQYRDTFHCVFPCHLEVLPFTPARRARFAAPLRVLSIGVNNSQYTDSEPTLVRGKDQDDLGHSPLGI
jgi:hypothetical protein